MQYKLTGICLLLIAGQHRAFGQTTAGAQDPPPDEPQTATVTLLALPEFVPMTQAERTRYYFKSTFSSSSLLFSAASAGISQWQNTPKEWRQGAEGYGRRFGNAYAKNIIRQTMMFGIASALHEDNRYLQSGQHGFGVRLKYAIASTVLARRDDGTRRLSFSRIGSTAGTAFIARMWQPPSTNKVADAVSGICISMGMQVAVNVAREFWHRNRER